MVDPDNKNTGDDFDDRFWDLDFAKPERKGPFTDGRHSTEAVAVDNVKDSDKSLKMSFVKVPSKLPPAVEITGNVNPVKAEKKRSARIYSDMDAERRLIKDSLEAAEKMGLKTEKTDVSSVLRLDSPPPPGTPGIRTSSPTVVSTAIPKRPEIYDKNIEEQKTAAGDFFDIPLPRFISGQNAGGTQSAPKNEAPYAGIPDDEIPYFTEDDPNMPPLEPPPENYGGSVPQGYVTPQVPQSPQNLHTAAFNQLYNRSGAGERKTQPSHKPSLVLEYSPEKSLIKKVSIFRWPSSYNFYEYFCRDAAKLFSKKGTKCPRAEFFSYIPQYNQLKRAQLDFYLWWRENFRNGVSIDADFSYILLYIYEIINLPELVPPEEGIKLLCRVWLEYRTKYLRIDKYLVEWVCDYCLIHNLPCPSAELKSILSVIAEKAALKEFYMSSPSVSEAVEQTVKTGENFNLTIKPPADALVSFVSNYDWKTSKFAQDTESDAYRIFDEHISKALDYVQLRCDETGRALIGGTSPRASLRITRVSRDAFCGSLCAYNVKRRIDAEVLSFSRSHEFRAQITDIVKYSENRIRAHLKIKSRLGTGNLPLHIRGFLDEYFNRHLPMQRRSGAGKNQTAENEYDKYYEAPESTLTAESADLIEKASWETTEMLIRAFAGDEPPSEIPPHTSNENAGLNSAGEACAEDGEYIEGEISFDSYASSGNPDKESGRVDEAGECDDGNSHFTEIHIEALKAALSGTFASYCRESGLFPETVSAEINDAAIILTGDIILEETENGFTIIEDYKNDISNFFK